MRFTSLLSLMLAIAAASGPACLGDPPMQLAREQTAKVEPGPTPILVPHIGDSWHSGCRLSRDPNSICPEDDQIDLQVVGNALDVVHQNASYNCCPADIAISMSIEEDVICLTEEEIFEDWPCPCVCCYDLGATVFDLAPGTYRVEYYWYDYELGDRSHVEYITITADVPMPPPNGPDRDDPPVTGRLAAPGGHRESAIPQLDSEQPFIPRVEECFNSGCLEDPNDPLWPPCGDDEILLVVIDGGFHVLHENATYNCCPDDIVISLEANGNLLCLTETEIATEPCWCLCCYDVEATIVGLSPGEYTIEFCWFDNDTNQVECYVEQIVIP